MMYLKFSFFGLLLYCCSFVQAQEIPTPREWKVIDTLSGNLDEDAIQEKVVVYNTIDSTDFGRQRELRIFKKKNEKWVLWESSRTALLHSDDGGMMGDPYGGMEIKNKVLSINHSGGSSWKWGYTDKYRFQDGQFELIGYSSLNGKPCEEWSKIDFNISTGKMNYTYETETCDSEDQVITKTQQETFYKKDITLTLKDRKSNEIEIILPKSNYKFHL